MSVSETTKTSEMEDNFFENVLGSPRHVVAPMVDQSELAWRMLSRQHGAQLCCTPMFHAAIFVRDAHYRKEVMQTCKEDRPLIVQFCANDPDTFVAAAKLVEHDCDAIDLNLGCPQNIAKRGRYGSYLQEHWDIIEEIVRKASQTLSIPITCKIRVFSSIEKTVEYAKMIEKAGAKMLTVHGRTRDQRGHHTGLANWEHIKAVRENVSIPVLANGNIQFLRDVDACITHTGVQGVMTAEGNLHNPALFSGRQPPVWELSNQYLDLVDKYPCPLSCVRGHMFKLWHAALKKYPDVRTQLGTVHSLCEMRETCNRITEMCQSDRDAADEGVDSEEPGRIPHWRCQPLVRPPPTQPIKRPLEETDSNHVKFDCPKAKRQIKHQQKIKEIQDNTNKQSQGRYILCEGCQCNARSDKCVNNFCRTCCKEKSRSKVLDCEGHKFKFGTRLALKTLQPDTVTKTHVEINQEEIPTK